MYSVLNEDNYSLAQRLGIALEKFLFAVIKSFFPKKIGYNYWHVDWDNYTDNSAPNKISEDFKLFFRGVLLMAIECKNWNFIQKHKYGVETVLKEIVSRLRNSNAPINLLLISFKDLLCKEAQKLLKQNNILVIETGKLVGEKDYRTRLFKELGYKIKKLLTKIQDRRDGFGVVVSNGCHSKQSTLHNADSSNNSNTNKLPNYVTNNVTYDCGINNLVKWIFERVNRSTSEPKLEFNVFG